MTLRVVTYERVSTSEQADSGAGLTAQRQAIEAAAQQRGWEIVATFTDAGLSGATLERPGLKEALALVENGGADALVVAKLDRLSRSLVNFAELMEQSRKRGWGLIALDLGVDTSTPAGEVLASVLSAFSQYERRLISARTKDALAVKKAEGVVLGRRRTLPNDVVARIVAERAAGATLDRIAEGLNADGVPTAQGGRRWYGSTVSAVLRYATRD